MKKENLLLLLYSSILFLTLLTINLLFLEGIPHVPDSVAYLFMAKMFASGHIISNIPVPYQFVDFFPGILSPDKGTWLFQYPFGHPLLLMLGAIFGIPQIIPPLIGTISIVLLYFIAKKIYDSKTAVFLLPLPFLSPFFLENASSFMSHNSAAFYLILSIYFLIGYYFHGGKYKLLISGIFIGLLFNTRPLTALPFLITGLIVILLQKKHSKKNIWLFIFGFSILFIMYAGYNYITSGQSLYLQYYQQNEGLFQNTSSTLSAFITERSKNAYILFTNLGPMIYNIPPIVTYALLLIPLLLKKNKFWDNLFFVLLFSLPLAYFFYNGTFIMYGPRFWYEIIPFIFLLTARAIKILSEKNFFATITFFSLFALLSLSNWFGITNAKDPDIFSPLKIQELKGFNFTNNGIQQTLEANKINNGVIFVEDCQGSWWCYGSVLSRNTSALDTPIVYLKDLGDDNNLKLRIIFPDKKFYRINYYSHALEAIN